MTDRMFKFSRKKRKEFQNIITSWYKDNGREFPWRETADPFKVLVAEVLLLQTFARKVVPVYTTITSLYPTPAALACADETDVIEIIRPLGLLYRASTLVSLGEEITLKYNGEVPKGLKELLTLKGVGEYTAHAVLCFAYKQPVPVVDRNVIRVYKRVFQIDRPLEKINPTKGFWLTAEKLVPRRGAREYNLGLLDFAALVCKHYSPLCTQCPAANICSNGQQK